MKPNPLRQINRKRNIEYNHTMPTYIPKPRYSSYNLTSNHPSTVQIQIATTTRFQSPPLPPPHPKNKNRPTTPILTSIHHTSTHSHTYLLTSLVSRPTTRLPSITSQLTVPSIHLIHPHSQLIGRPRYITEHSPSRIARPIQKYHASDLFP